MLPPYQQDSVKCVTKGDLNNGVIICTIKTGLPYDLWEIKKVAREAGLHCVRSMDFIPQYFPGYTHRRTIGHDLLKSNPDNSEITKGSKMYIFAKN